MGSAIYTRLLYSLVVFSVFMENQVFAQPFGSERIVIDQSNESISPKSVYTVDIDGDGDMDVLSTSGNRTLAWHENVDGLGRFSNKNLIDDRDQRGSILHISDLDGDGDPDLLTDGYSDSGVAWYENVDGKGTYDVLQILSDEIKDIRDVYTADLDGDGDLDVVTASKSPSKLSWLENIDGTGALSEAKLVATLNRDLNALKTADFDNDGDMDILAVSSDTLGLVWYENTDGRGDFQKVHLISGDSVEVSDAQILDLEGDGDMDIFAIGDGVLLWYENTDGTGSFEFYYSLKTPTEYNWCFLAQDVDRDEDADIVIGSFFPSQLLWYEHKREEQIFTEQAEIEIGFIDVRYIDAGDIDADGGIDLVFASSFNFDQLAWLPNLDGRGEFGSINTISASVRGLRSVHAADIDGDGKKDILSASHLDGKLAWYQQLDESGHFAQQLIFGKSSAKDISTADFDGDGDLDVLAPDIDWYENIDGKGDLSVKHKVSSEVADVRSVKAADIDGDGDEDILAASYLYDEVVWFENTDGLGSFGPKRLIDSLVYFVSSVFPADLDGDGDLDVVSGSASLSTVVWYENIDGRGQFGPRKSVSKDMSSVNPLELEQWDFYILSTSVLNEKAPEQQTITLSRLLDLEPTQVKYDGLGAEINKRDNKSVQPTANAAAD